MSISEALDRYFGAWDAHDGGAVVASLTSDAVASRETPSCG
jgi:hypothetical protein